MQLGAFPIPRFASVLSLIEEYSPAEIYQTSSGAKAKANCEPAPYCIPNEFICTEIGRLLGLPIPPCALMRADGLGKPLFVSLDFGFTGEALPPLDDAGSCCRDFPEMVAGILMFDVFIANADRHKYNICMNMFEKDLLGKAKPSLSIFDQGAALFGRTPEQGAARLEESKKVLQLGNHCLRTAIDKDDYFDQWLKRIEAIPKFVFEDLCGRVIGLGIDDTEAKLAVEFLVERQASIRDLIGNNKKEFPNIQNWKVWTK